MARSVLELTFLGKDSGTLLAQAPLFACIAGTGVVVCAFFFVSLLAFRRTAPISSPNDACAAPPPAVSASFSSNASNTTYRIAEIADRAGLTQKEQDVAALLYRGYTNKRIAEVQCVSINTVQTHVQNCYRKLGIHAKQELIDLVDASPKH